MRTQNVLWNNLGDEISEVIDPAGRKCGYEYDGYGRLKKEIDYYGTGPYTEAAHAEWFYDSQMGDRVDYQVDRNGNTIDYGYNKAGLITSIDYTTAAPESENDGHLGIEYDTAGREQTITAKACDTCDEVVMQREYTDNGSLDWRESEFPGSPRGKIDYGYDGIGRLQTVQSPDAQGDPDATVTYSYDAANRVTDVVGPTSSAWYAYNKASQLTRIDRGAADDISFSAAWKGSSSSYDYYLPGDPSQGRLKTISHRWNNKGERKLDFSYNYNTDGLINGMTIDKHIPYVDDNLAVDYQYDSQGRLKDEMGYDLSEAEPRTAVYERHYEYDDAGNRTSMRLVNRDSSDVTWHFLIDDRNRMWGRFVGNDWDDGTKRWWYGYDDNGNLTVAMDQTKENGTWQEGNRWYYTWNTRDEMTRVEKYAYGGNTLVLGEEYRYSLAGSGERTERISYVGNDHYILSWYRYENDGLLTYRVDEKYDADQNDIDEADPWRVREKRTYGPGLVGNLISKEVLEYPSRYSADNVESRVYFYDYDAQGNVALVTEQYCTGSTFKYIFHQDAFGNTLGTQGFHGNGWIDTSDAGITEHQTGKEYNIYTGLYYFNHRWYDPVVGRFISRDPDASNSEVTNGYIFCANNPVMFVDPSGLVCAPATWVSLLPVVGSSWQAYYDFQEGHYVWGTFNTVMAFSDLFLIKSLASGIARGAWSYSSRTWELWKRGSQTWEATRKWLRRIGWKTSKDEVFHHWAIPRNGWGKPYPDWLKNHPLNIMVLPDEAFHNAVEGKRSEVYLRPWQRIWYGTPHWFKSVITSVSGRVAELLRDRDDCN
jgi:RHS repeat-associated protein